MQPACPVPSSSTALIVADVCLRERAAAAAAATFPLRSLGISRPLKSKRLMFFCFVLFVFFFLFLSMDNRQWFIFGDPLKRLKVKERKKQKQDRNERRRQVLLACLK